MKKKLLYIVESFGGGVFSFLSELSFGLCDKYELFIAHSMRAETPSNYKEYFPNNVKFIRLENFSREINIGRELRAIAEIKRLVKEISPDIVHLHSTKAGAVGRLALAFREHTYKLFYTPHNYAFNMLDAGKAKRLIYKTIEKICALGNAVTIACSDFEYRLTSKLTDKAEVVNNGIDTAVIDGIRNSLEIVKKEKFTVCTLGRITKAKNPMLFNEIARKCPEVDFLWIGDGEERKLLNADNISVSGWVDKKEAVRLLCSCNVFVLPSMWESLSLSLLEAMYSGLVVLASDIEGNRAVISDKQNGFLCTGKEDYIKLIKDIRSFELETAVICDNARATVSSKYQVSEMIRKYIEIYG